MVCRNQGCSCCEQDHQECTLINFHEFISRVEKKKKPVSNKIISIIDNIDQCYLKAIEKLSIDRYELNQWKDNYGLN